MPLSVIRTPAKKTIWDDLNPFVEKLVGAYKQSQMNKWDNEWQSEALKIVTEAGHQESTKNLLANTIPPTIDTEGATNFAKETVGNMGMVQQKEVMTGGLSPISARPEATATEQVGEKPKMIPDEMEFNEVYKMISELPSGKIDWSSLTGMFRQRMESKKAMGTAAQQFLNMIMEQSAPTDQRAKLGQDIDMTNKVMAALYPEQEKPSSDYERWKADPEGYEAFKAVGKEEEKVFDFETFLKENKDWQIKTVNSKGDITVGRKTPTTKKWEFDTWGEAEEWTKAHEQEGYEWKIETQGEGFNVTAMKKASTPDPGTKKLVPTYGVIETISGDLLNKDIDYDTALSRANVKYDLSDPNIKLPQKEDRGKAIYDFALTGDNSRFGIPEIIDEEGSLKENTSKIDYIAGYSKLYSEYEQGAREYYEATGKLLPREYLSLEEYEKSDIKPKSWKPNTWGQQKSVKNTENIPWSFSDKTQEVYDQMIQQSLTIKDMDLQALAKDGVDINKLLSMF